MYTIVQNLNIPLILQPQLFATLCFVSWAQVGSIILIFCAGVLTFLQCLYYGKKYSKAKSIGMFLLMIIIAGGFEVGMVFAVKVSLALRNYEPCSLSLASRHFMPVTLHRYSFSVS